jgi:hypothetical protein
MIPMKRAITGTHGLRSQMIAASEIRQATI